MKTTLPANFIPKKPFPGFKWKWASLQCTESLNDPVVLLGVLFRMRKLEQSGTFKYSSEEFASELRGLSNDIKDSIGVDLARRTGERNLIRNSGQYWRAVGLLADDNKGVIELSDFGRKVADREISQTEFAAVTIQTFQLPNRQTQSDEETALWESHGLVLHPFRILLQTLRTLRQMFGENEGFVTPFELAKIIIPLSGNKAEAADYANFIHRHRQGGLDLSKWPDCTPGANDFRIAREYLLFLSNYGYVNRLEEGKGREDEIYIYNAVLDSEIETLLSVPAREASVNIIRDTSVASDIERRRIGTARQGQARFRRDILNEFGRCVITNVTMPEVLETAHIKPFRYNGENTVANGFAMRLDIHLLFDAGHLRISEIGEVRLSTRARLDYGALIPPRIVLPDCTNREFLRWRWDNFDGL